MKSTGVVRKIDDLGRVVLPSELRKVFGIRVGDELDISVEGDRIILQKRQDQCLFCGADQPAIEFKGRRICDDCATELGSLGPTAVHLSDVERTTSAG